MKVKLEWVIWGKNLANAGKTGRKAGQLTRLSLPIQMEVSVGTARLDIAGTVRDSQSESRQEPTN